MLKIENMNYNANAQSVDENDQDNVFASMNFNADMDNFYFNVNFSSKAALRNTTVDSDFSEFKEMTADMLDPQ